MKSFLFVFLFSISGWAASETCEYQFKKGKVLHKGVASFVQNASGKFDITLSKQSPRRSDYLGEGTFEEAKGDDLDEEVEFCYEIERQSGKEFCKDIKRVTSIGEETAIAVGIVHYFDARDEILARYLIAPDWFPKFTICRN